MSMNIVSWQRFLRSSARWRRLRSIIVICFFFFFLSELQRPKVANVVEYCSLLCLRTARLVRASLLLLAAAPGQMFVRHPHPCSHSSIHLGVNTGSHLQGRGNLRVACCLRVAGSRESVCVHQHAECVHYSAEQLTRPD